MSRFCKECGNPVSEEALFCKNCGTKVNKIPSESASSKVQKEQNDQITSQIPTPQNEFENVTQQYEPSKEKKPLSKKQKLIYSLIGILAIAGIGFYVWGSSYYAADKVIERFVDALVEQDEKEIHRLVRMDGEEISEEETQALARLVEVNHRNININENRPERLLEDNSYFSIDEADEKGMFLFTQYIIEVEPQYIQMSYGAENVETTFNGKEFDISDQIDYVIEYGPLAPGVYRVTSKVNTDFGDVEEEQTITLVDSYNSGTLDFNVSEVTVYPVLWTSLPYEEITFTIGGQPVDIDPTEYGVDIGTMPIDGPLALETTVETAWGTMELEPAVIESSFIDLEIDIYNETLKEEMAEAIVHFAEEYIIAFANHDVSNMQYASVRLQEDIAFDFEYYPEEFYFEGNLNEVGISFADLEEMYMYSDDGPHFEVPVELYMTGAFDEGEDHEEVTLPFLLEIKYHDEQWIANSLYDTSSVTPTDYEMYDVSGEAVEGNSTVNEDAEADSEREEEENNAEDADLYDIEVHVENYVYSLVDAINTGDYSLVEGYIASASDFEAIQKDLVERLYNNELTQEVISVTVENIDEINSEEWLVSTNETIELNYASGNTEAEDYQWTYTVKLADDGYHITNLE